MNNVIFYIIIEVSIAILYLFRFNISIFVSAFPLSRSKLKITYLCFTHIVSSEVRLSIHRSCGYELTFHCSISKYDVLTDLCKSLGVNEQFKY